MNEEMDRKQEARVQLLRLKARGEPIILGPGPLKATLVKAVNEPIECQVHEACLD